MSAVNKTNDISFADYSEINDFQFNQIKHTLSYAKANSPFYQKLFSKNSIDISVIKTGVDFSKIPFTLKEDLCENPDDFLCVPKHKIAEYTTTSGSLGKPATMCLTANDLERLAKNEANSMLIAGCTSDDIFQLATTMDKRFMAGLAYCEGVRKLGAGLIRVGASAPALQWDSILRFKPTVLIAIPSFVLSLIDYAKSNGIDVKQSSLKKLIAIGQPIRDVDLQLNIIGKKIATEWGLEIHSTYAATEMACAYTECSESCGGHEQPDLIYTEILDENDNQVSDGEHGEIVITTLGVEAMPLIRYRTGDIARVYKTACSCGRKTLRLGPIIGRKNHIIKFKGTTVHPSAIIPILDVRKECSPYLIELSTDELGLDNLTLVFSNETITDQKAIEIINDLSELIKVKPNFKRIEKQILQQLIFDPSSRKPIKIIDLRKQTF